MRIDIWSDLVCPWCYVGKRRFERALAELPGVGEIQVVHRSFQLNPTMPKGQTVRRRDMLMSKYQLTESQVEALNRKMEQTAAGEGLEFHLGDDGLTGNTVGAHQLVHLARERGVQDAAVERFFRAYFSEQRSLFDDDSLVDFATEAGLDADESRRVLRESVYARAVAADGREARELGASGVPFFVIDGRYGVSGAQPTDVLIAALMRARALRVARGVRS